MTHINYLTKGQYSANKNVSLKRLRSDLCDNSDAFIFVKGTITVEGDDDDKTRNNVLFRSCISKINNTYL